MTSVFRNSGRPSECPHHPRPEFRECHHVDDRYVAVYWGASPFGGEGWMVRSGTIGKRGSMTSWADTELDWMLERLRA